MLPLSSVRPGDIRHIRFSFACSRRQTTRRQSEAPKDVPDHTSCRALSLHSLTDLFAGAPHPYYRTSAPFSSSVGERKIMNHSFENLAGGGVHAAVAIGDSSTSCPSSWSLRTW